MRDSPAHRQYASAYQAQVQHDGSRSILFGKRVEHVLACVVAGNLSITPAVDP